MELSQLSFKNIYTIGNVIVENELYTHVHYPQFLIRYDSNFIEFHRNPSVTEFKNTEDYISEYHLSKGQNHLKFYFPDNSNLTEKLLGYLSDQEYDLGWMELYAIEPSNFPEAQQREEIEVKDVAENNLEDYLRLQYKHDVPFGHAFAEQKQKLLISQFNQADVIQIIAYYKNIPVGFVDVIISDDTAEIDSLTVDETYQRKGIGTKLQEYVMDKFHAKMIILVADGEDTPREMYQKQNYQCIGFKYEAFKYLA